MKARTTVQTDARTYETYYICNDCLGQTILAPECAFGRTQNVGESNRDSTNVHVLYSAHFVRFASHVRTHSPVG